MFRYLLNVEKLLLTRSVDTLMYAQVININQRQYSNLQYYHLKYKETCYVFPHLKNNCSVYLQYHEVRCNSSVATSKNIFNDKYFSDKDLEHVSCKYPNPKLLLNNYYTIVSNELKVPHQLIAHYKMPAHRKGESRRDWCCTYSVQWPQETRVTATGPTKAEASCKASLRLIYLLEQAGKIMNNGQPVIYDQKSFEQITKKNYASLQLDSSVESSLKQICYLYDVLKGEMVLSDVMQMYDNKQLMSSDSTFNSWQLNRQHFKSLSTYRIKESTLLPIQTRRNELGRLLELNKVIIVRGEPGCGKSTRVPQYVLEQWVMRKGDKQACRVAVTQPRRIAAISLAERVAQERGELVGDVVGYQVRLSSKFNPRTGRILYCTTGILLRKLQADPQLAQFTHILLDEAHERDINTDLLLNLLRRALQLNPQLQLLIMSATIDVSLFTRYFRGAPVLEVPGFTYPVQQHFLEDIPLRLEQTRQVRSDANPQLVTEEVAELINWIDKTKPQGAVLCFLPGWDEICKVQKQLCYVLDSNMCIVLTLHSKLSDVDQKKIFSRPPIGIRKIILATNIAETSVTVDDVVHVVDCGTHRELRYDPDKGINCMDTYWISQSSVKQRRGRAGRVQPGFSYHLYPRSVYKSMPKYSMPEILRVSLTKIVLDSKVYSGGEATDEFFGNLPSPPEQMVVSRAVRELQQLELLDEQEHVTPLGRVLAEFQLAPDLAKAMVHAAIYKCVTPLVDIATVFSADVEMFGTVLQDKRAIRQTKKELCSTSDHVALMLLLEQCLTILQQKDYQTAQHFCHKNNLIFNKINTLRKLRDIHFEYLKKYLKDSLELSDELSDNEEIIRGVLLSGVGNILTHRSWNIVKGRLKTTDTYTTKNGQKATITPDSVNSKRNYYKSPFYVYINETRSVVRRTNLIRETSLINPLTILLFKNGNITIQKFSKKKTDDSEKQVILQFGDEKIKFVCSNSQAELILKTNRILRNMEKHFIKRFTSGEKGCQKIHEHWQQILQILNGILCSERPPIK